MRISIRSPQGLLSPAFSEHIQKRLHDALDRLSSLIAKVEFRVADLNGPRGGEDKLCSAVVALRQGNSIKVQVVDADAYRAVDEVARKLKQTLSRRKGRRAEFIRDEAVIAG